MAAPLSFSAFTGWIDLSDPDNIPEGARLIGASDLLRYENGISALVGRVNEHDTTLGTLGDNTSALTALGATGATVPVLKLPKYTTAGRPDPAAAGAGAAVYDTTLSKPVYSDGTIWRDAAGTAA